MDKCLLTTPLQVEMPAEHQFAQYMTVSASGEIVATGLALMGTGSKDPGCIRIGEIRGNEVAKIAVPNKCADAGGPGGLNDRMPTGWNVVATDGRGTILVAATGFSGSGKGLLLRKHEDVFRKEKAEFPPDVTAAAVSADGSLIVVGDRFDAISSLEEANGVFEQTNIATDRFVLCEILRPAAPRGGDCSLRKRQYAKFLVATQEGCLALFVKDASSWRPQVLIDTQMPDVVAASVSPDSRWAVLGTTSGRIQIWDLLDLKRPPATVDARLPWSSTFAWLSPGETQWESG